MKTLYIDTHLFDIDIILFEDDKIIKREIVKDKKDNRTYLMPTIMNVCPNKDFDEIIVVNGPGSFTGVRLGITIAKTLAYTLNKVIKPVSYFDMQNYSLESSNHILSMNDGNGYFIAEYENHKLIKPLYYLSNKDYSEFAKNKDIKTDVSIDFAKVLLHLKNVSGVNPHSIKPLYIKLIGVEQ